MRLEELMDVRDGVSRLLSVPVPRLEPVNEPEG